MTFLLLCCTISYSIARFRHGFSSVTTLSSLSPLHLHIPFLINIIASSLVSSVSMRRCCTNIETNKDLVLSGGALALSRFQHQSSSHGYL